MNWMEVEGFCEDGAERSVSVKAMTFIRKGLNTNEVRTQLIREEGLPCLWETAHWNFSWSSMNELYFSLSPQN